MRRVCPAPVLSAATIVGVAAVLTLAACAAVRPETRQAQLAASARRCDEARSRWYAGDADGARAALEDAVALSPADAEAWRLLGALDLSRGEPARARRRFERALALRPDLHAARADLGAALLAEQRFADAARVFGALADEPAYGEPQRAHAGLAWALVNLGRLREAARHYKIALAYDPGLCEGYERLGRIYEVTGDWAEALDAYEQVARRCARPGGGSAAAPGPGVPVLGLANPL
jgi:Tfp pilus assembly protein PilF